MRRAEDPGDLFHRKKIMGLLIPLVAECILLSMMGMADTLMVANAGEAAVSAVSLVNQMNNVLLQLFSALSVGGSVVVSQLVGARDMHEARQCARQLLQSVLIVALFLMLICCTLRFSMLRLVYPHVDGEVMENCMTYFLVTAISYPFLAVGSAASSVFRVGGNTRTPMIVNIMANLLNVAGNAWLIFGLKLGVLGAALPTLASRVFSAVVLSLLLRSDGQPLHCRKWILMKPNLKRIGKMARIGIPTGIENAGFELGKLIISGVLSRESTAALAANALEITFEGFSTQFNSGACMTALIVVGTCVGAGRYDEARRQVWRLCLISKLGTVFMCLATIALARPVAAFSGLSAEATELFVRMNTIVHLLKLVPFECYVFSNALRAAGDVRFTMVASLIVMWGVRVAVSLVAELVFHAGVMSMWIGMTTDWFTRLFVFGIRFLRGRWVGKSVVRSGG